MVYTIIYDDDDDDDDDDFAYYILSDDRILELRKKQYTIKYTTSNPIELDFKTKTT